MCIRSDPPFTCETHRPSGSTINLYCSKFFSVSFHDSALNSIKNKLDLFEYEPPRFAVRSMLAGMYLGIMTAFASATATLLEPVAAGWGKYAFGMIFACTLYIIVVLQAELATGDMLFMTYGAVHGKNNIPHGIFVVLIVTFFNLFGAVFITWLISNTTIGSSIAPGDFLENLMVSKLEKPSGILFVEAILANMVVCIAFMLTVQAGKDYTAKLLSVILIVPAFATMSYEHSIANFVLTSLSGFTLGPEQIEGFTFWNVIRNWTIVWLGNFVGGGLIMGGLYGWLNMTKTNYKD